MAKLGSIKKLSAYKHFGYWYCMDTIRDKEIIEKILKKKLNFEKKSIIIFGGRGFIGKKFNIKIGKKKFLSHNCFKKQINKL